MKIFLVTKDLSGVVGGVERQLGNIALRLKDSGHEVVILSSDAESPEVFYSHLSEFSLRNYGRIALNPNSKNKERLYRQRTLYRIVKSQKPDLIIGFMLSGYLVAMFSAMYRGIPIVLAERNSPDVYNLTRARKFKFLYFQLMRFASGITVQLDCYIDKYPKFLRKKIKVIYNEILVSPKKLEKKQSEQIFTFGFVGRFSYQKQPLRLLESFSRHVARDSGSRLVFFGKGELESEMRAMIEDYNLETFVRIEPPSKDLEHIYSSFDALCLPSLWEGFPNVVGEAMAYGIPVLGNVNCLGLQEIIEENIGILAEFENENTDGFRNLKQLMSSRPQLSTEIHSHFMTLQNYNFQFLWNEVANDAIKQI